jgi:hypothetical protein
MNYRMLQFVDIAEWIYLVHTFFSDTFQNLTGIYCPIVEYGAFDIKAGDIFFLDLWPKNG